MDVLLSSREHFQTCQLEKLSHAWVRQKHSCRLFVIEIMSAADVLPLETNWIISKVFRNGGFHSMWYVWRPHCYTKTLFLYTGLLIGSTLGSMSSFHKVKHCSREEELTVKGQEAIYYEPCKSFPCLPSFSWISLMLSWHCLSCLVVSSLGKSLFL